jgi:hypothetical protein
VIVENGEEVYSHPAESSAPTGINHSGSESLHVVVGVSATFPLPRIIGRVDGLKLNVEGQCRHLDCMYRERKAIGWIVTHRWTPGSGVPVSRLPGLDSGRAQGRVCAQVRSQWRHSVERKTESDDV